MQIVALHVADQHSVEIELMQVATAVIQMIEVLATRQGQRGQVAERIVFVSQATLRRSFLDQAALYVVGKFQLFLADAELFANDLR